MSDLLALATMFSFPDADNPLSSVNVELTCRAGEGPHKPPHDTWAVRCRRWCLDRNHDWVYEPSPSSRDDEFLAATRWTRDEALEHARQVWEGGNLP